MSGFTNVGSINNSYPYKRKKVHGHRLSHKDGYLLEHRLIYEQTNKCCLLPWSAIHHIDGDKKNNDPINLVGMIAEHHIKMEAKTRLNEDFIQRNCVRCGKEIISLVKICKKCRGREYRIKVRENAFNSYIRGLKNVR
jgi:HNH endonuclease